MTPPDLYLKLMQRGIVPALDEVGIELDQRLRRSLEISIVSRGDLFPIVRNPLVNEVDVFASLCRVNGSLTRALGPDVAKLLQTYEYGTQGCRKAQKPGEVVSAGPHLAEVLLRAVELRRAKETLASQDFLRAAVDSERLQSFVTSSVGHYAFDDNGVFSLISEYCSGLDEDFQYVLALERNRVVFRIVSTLDDYIQRSDTGSLNSHRVLLTHFRDHFGGFSPEEILELEDLLNDPSAREAQFQEFFERHTHFLRVHDYREVYSHVVLRKRDDERSLIPDFILTNIDTQRAAIMELKLPSARLVREQKNRRRFSSAVMEARAQLLTYRNYFREQACRETISQAVGMRIYEPALFVLIGRSSEFRSDLDRQELRANHADIEVFTYDDILAHAARRRLVIARS